MITLKKDNIVMEVCTEVQASVFLRSGYVRVDNVPAEAADVTAAETPKEAPKRRRRKATE